MEIYIIRHGETIWNAAGKLQGRTDIELNESGRQAAIDLGMQLDADKIDFDAIYASPLIRAYETACLIRGRNNVPIIRDDRLKEICFGTFEGCHYTEWMNDESPYRFFFNAPALYNPPEGGESLEECMIRTKEFMQEVIEPLYSSARRIMIVAHGALNKGIVCYLEGNTKDNYWGKGLQKNCAADIFDYDGVNWRKITQ